MICTTTRVVNVFLLTHSSHLKVFESDSVMSDAVCTNENGSDMFQSGSESFLFIIIIFC